MSLKFCPHCGNKLDGSPKFCPKCGYNLAGFQNESKNESHQKKNAGLANHPINNPIIEEEKRRIEAAKGIKDDEEGDKKQDEQDRKVRQEEHLANHQINNPIIEEEKRRIESDPNYKKSSNDNSISYAEYQREQDAKEKRHEARKELWDKLTESKPKKPHYVRNTLLFGLAGTIHSSHTDKKNQRKNK